MPSHHTLFPKAILIPAILLAAAPVQADSEGEQVEFPAAPETEEATAPEPTMPAITAPLLTPPEVVIPPPAEFGMTALASGKAHSIALVTICEAKHRASAEAAAVYVAKKHVKEEAAAATAAKEKIREQLDIIRQAQAQAASSEARAEQREEDLEHKNREPKAALARAEAATKQANKLLDEERVRRKRAEEKLNGATRTRTLR